MRTTRIQPEALEHLSEWATYEPKLLKRIFRILEECCRTPFEGIGKPEALKGDKRGLWSRRITDEHRIVYDVTDSEIIVHALKGHYED
ncbi:Txe/YoeB family addiction module toxin [Spirosoma linguale]|uniref:Putative mRNA interferase YoeB n=1 Tax=Spirosoma linguale (strain ATCC 33905 / DSM 74 / LMG 10896 / Claus 1) TaxID=504472 RepID=D2QPG6_SPILD|nr:addiction module toxin, Txe/YoeB family [Spirosoma linguale DSM 74]